MKLRKLVLLPVFALSFGLIACEAPEPTIEDTDVEMPEVDPSLQEDVEDLEEELESNIEAPLMDAKEDAIDAVELEGEAAIDNIESEVDAAVEEIEELKPDANVELDVDTSVELEEVE